MKKLFLILFIYLAYVQVVNAQYNTNQNKVWAFGIHAGLSFVSGSPVPITTQIGSSEACASVCTNTGDLRFYTNGRIVWDRTHAIMMGGTVICPLETSSATQGALIVPVMNYATGSDPTQYHIFSVPGIEHVIWLGDTLGLTLYHCIVDMTLNGGYGAVVPGSAGTVMGNHMSEKIIAVPGNNCNVWVLTHRRDSPVIYAWEVSAAGVSATPVISVAGTMAGPIAYGAGVMKISPDRRKLAVINPITYASLTGIPTIIDSLTGVELFDFDPSTGIVSNCVMVKKGGIFKGYSCEFSPDNTKLYVGYSISTGTSLLVQYDISDTAALQTSADTVVTASAFFNDIRLAPDGMIYFRSPGTSDLISRIAAPNAAGSACTVQPDVVTLLPGTTAHVGLANVYQEPLYLPVDTATTFFDTTVCFDNVDSLVLSSPYASPFMWYNGSTSPTCIITGEGQYTITYATGCLAYKHTFNVHAALSPCLTTGIGQAQLHNNVWLNPNPAVNECNVRSDKPLSPGTKAWVYDLTGRVMGEYLLGPYDTFISLNDMPAGVCTVRILLGEATTIRKLVITK